MQDARWCNIHGERFGNPVVAESGPDDAMFGAMMVGRVGGDPSITAWNCTIAPLCSSSNTTWSGSCRSMVRISDWVVWNRNEGKSGGEVFGAMMMDKILLGSSPIFTAVQGGIAGFWIAWTRKSTSHLA